MNYYTHAGLFHCDEVTGFAICYLAGICDSAVRLEDVNNIPKVGIVADIGRIHDPVLDRFDHHQGLIQRKSGHPYASAGLIWEKYGHIVVQEVLMDSSKENNKHHDIEQIVNRVDEVLIKGIDAHDSDNNYNLEATCIAGKVKVLTLPNIVSLFNTSDVHDSINQYNAFCNAAMFMENIIRNQVILAEKFIKDTKKFKEIYKVDGEVITLSEVVGWKEIVHDNYPNTKYVVLPSSHPGNPWSLIAVPTEPDKRKVKIPIERPDWFNGFIHQGKWIAGGMSADEMNALAVFNLNQ